MDRKAEVAEYCIPNRFLFDPPPSWNILRNYNYMTPKEQSEQDQLLASACETFPIIWKRMFDNLIQQGFTKRQALVILKTFILSCGNKS